MLICHTCGCIFEEPEHYWECLDRSLAYYEEWDGCPFCTESNYEEYDPYSDLD